MRTPFYDTENRIQSQFKPPPDLLTPYAMQLALMPMQLYSFSRALTTVSKYLYGAGTNAEFREYPLPYDGWLVKLIAYSDSDEIFESTDAPASFLAGDRLSCYAQYMGSGFNLRARINGVTKLNTVDNTPENITLFATIGIRFQRFVT